MKYAPYKEYSVCSSPLIEKIPVHWIEQRVKFQLQECISGGTPDSGNQFYWKESGFGVPWVSITDMTGSDVITQTQKDISEEGIKAKGLEIVPAGTLLYSIFASLGKVAEAGVDLITNQAILALKPKKTLKNAYFKYWLQSIESYLAYFSTSNTQNNLNAEKVKNLPLFLPPEVEQEVVANFLDHETAKIDALIEKQQQLIQLLKEKRQAVISHAVTKGLNPNVPMCDSGVEWLGDVPEHWEVKRLRFIADVQSGVAKGKDNSGLETIEVPYLRVANVQDGFLDLETVTTIEIPSSSLDRYRLRVGDVLMNEGGDFDKLGRGHIWNGEIDPCIHQNHVFAIRPKAVSSEWLNEITGSHYAQFYFVTRSKQSTNLASISSTNIMELPVVLPPPREQQQILETVTKQRARFDALTAKAQRAIELLKERRTALISAAVTGKIDVRHWKAPLNEDNMETTL